MLTRAHRRGRLPRIRNADPVALGVDARVPRREPVAEAVVDAALGRPEDGERLAAVAGVVELAPHQAASGSRGGGGVGWTPTAVTPAAGTSPPGTVSANAERRGRPDDRRSRRTRRGSRSGIDEPAHPLELDRSSRLLAKPTRDRLDEVLELVGRRAADLDVHPAHRQPLERRVLEHQPALDSVARRSGR